VEWSGSKPAGWQTLLVATKRGGVTGRLLYDGGDRRWGKTSASRSRGHQRGLSGCGGSTRRCEAWGGVGTIGEGLEWAIRGCSATVSTTVFGAAQER
jgi:hypothetical protein